MPANDKEVIVIPDWEALVAPLIDVPLAKFGDNQLGAKLTSSIGKDDLVIQELEVVATPVSITKRP